MIAKIAKPTVETGEKVRPNWKNSFGAVEKNSEGKNENSRWSGRLR
jgi:hypothetical protein